MSDTSSAVLDPKRPWLTDERELPSQMNWTQTLFDPTGASPKLHFTRAWTMLFVMQLLVIILPFTIALVLNAAGGDGKPVGTFGLYATPVVFIVTTFMSYVIHSRRLNDARKSQLWALVPLIPLVLGMVVCMGSAAQASAQYDHRFETRQQYLADPDAFRAKQRETQEQAKAEAAKAAENGEEASSGKPQQGQQHGGGAHKSPDAPLPPKAPTVLKAALPMFQNIMIPLSGLIAIWSLMWVARVPYFGVYPGDENFRGEQV